MVLSSTTNWCSMCVFCNHQALQMSSFPLSKNPLNFITSKLIYSNYSLLLLWSSNPAPLHVSFGPSSQLKHPYVWDIAYNNAGLFLACMSCSYENVSFHCKSRFCGCDVVSLTYSNKCSFLPWLLVIFIYWATGLRVCKLANLRTSIVNLLQMLTHTLQTETS